ncbi:MAG TPA: flavodoxin family protein [Thermotogota bacterium]|nr:flavodoxin family protein [Thermotogota bacterium]
MKVTAIIGSPHLGNGYKISEQLETELKKLGIEVFERILLKDAHLEMCKGCFLCISRGGEFCPLKDDKAEIERKLLESDGIILISPGYAQNVSGLMKNFIDRFAHTLHRPIFFGQSMMLVANGGSGLTKVIKALSISLGGARIVSKLKITATPWKMTPSYKTTTEKAIKEACQKFYEDLSDKRLRKPSLGNVIWFQIFKKMSALSEKRLPADFAFYGEKTSYFYEVKVNPLYTVLAKFIAFAAVKSLKKQVLFE